MKSNVFSQVENFAADCHPKIVAMAVRAKLLGRDLHENRNREVTAPKRAPPIATRTCRDGAFGRALDRRTQSIRPPEVAELPGTKLLTMLARDVRYSTYIPALGLLCAPFVTCSTMHSSCFPGFHQKHRQTGLFEQHVSVAPGNDRAVM